jgi:Tfp pilus assembly protein PilV
MTALRSNQRRTTRCSDAIAGFTLIEILVGLVSSTVLVAGLSSAIYISSQALDLESSASRQSTIASEVLSEMTADLALALSFSERTAKAVTFDVPDRDGDLHPETIRYAWSGTPGDPLTYQYNGGTEITQATDVQSLDLAALTRMSIGPQVVATLPEVVFEEFTEAKLSAKALSLTIDVPSSTSEGDLLIVAMALDGPLNGLAAPAGGGWNLLDLEESPGVKSHFGVWWKIATAAEASSYTFTWNSEENAYGWMMRFTDHDPASPIHQYAVGGGSSDTPISPAVTTTIGYTMILRIIGLNLNHITVDVPGLGGHTTITMDQSDTSNGSASGGAAYVLQSADGDSGTANFVLTKSAAYRTVTIAIAPDPY